MITLAEEDEEAIVLLDLSWKPPMSAPSRAETKVPNSLHLDRIDSSFERSWRRYLLGAVGGQSVLVSLDPNGTMDRAVECPSDLDTIAWVDAKGRVWLRSEWLTGLGFDLVDFGKAQPLPEALDVISRVKGSTRGKIYGVICAFNEGDPDTAYMGIPDERGFSVYRVQVGSGATNQGSGQAGHP